MTFCNVFIFNFRVFLIRMLSGGVIARRFVSEGPVNGKNTKANVPPSSGTHRKRSSRCPRELHTVTRQPPGIALKKPCQQILKLLLEWSVVEWSQSEACPTPKHCSINEDGFAMTIVYNCIERMFQSLLTCLQYMGSHIAACCRIVEC